ncbi:MAG TPA: ABC transporter substrate-binding protein [Kofleriaceae bacterium]|nr:ABC transporter substrate-binding protein [Kofleriaceae bacterium]
MILRGACVVAAAVLAACGDHHAPRVEGADAPLSISIEQQSTWVRNFNPLLPPGRSRWPTRAGVYEPLEIYNAMTGQFTPWLATEHAWSDDLLKLTFTIRAGVRWSDGAPFSADDVAFTFSLLRDHAALDLAYVWGFVEDVRAIDPLTVEVSFKRPYVPGLADLAHQPIVPRHVWQRVADPVTYSNPNPVGTGPFTEVLAFRDQVYELGKNPHYWQPGRPKVRSLRFLAYPSNDQANLALVEGDVDWAGNFVPAVDRTFVARDPEHHHAWSPLVGNMVLLWANTTRAPLGDERVRKALSMAIDRERLVEVAMYGMTRPADASGLTDAYRLWKDADAGRAPWMALDRAAAERLLDEAGCRRGAGGVRRDPAGNALAFDIEVVSGWSDWVRAAQLIARDLQAIGVDAHLRVYDFGAWMSRLQEGTFALSVGYSLDGPTPFQFYRWTMASRTVKPVGKLAPGNWHRFGDAEADRLLDAFERAATPEAQRAIGVSLQRRFAEVAPAIPLFPNPMWGEFSTARFVGFPDASKPFARLSPHAEPDMLLVLTAVEPRGEDTP